MQPVQQVYQPPVQPAPVIPQVNYGGSSGQAAANANANAIAGASGGAGQQVYQPVQPAPVPVQPIQVPQVNYGGASGQAGANANANAGAGSYTQPIKTQAPIGGYQVQPSGGSYGNSGANANAAANANAGAKAGGYGQGGSSGLYEVDDSQNGIVLNQGSPAGYGSGGSSANANANAIANAGSSTGGFNVVPAAPSGGYGGKFASNIGSDF